MSSEDAGESAEVTDPLTARADVITTSQSNAIATEQTDTHDTTTVPLNGNTSSTSAGDATGSTSDTSQQPSAVSAQQPSLPTAADIQMFVTYHAAADGSVEINRAFVGDLEQQWGKPPAYEELYPGYGHEPVRQQQNSNPTNSLNNSVEPMAAVAISIDPMNDDDVPPEREARFCCTCNCVVLTIIALFILYLLLYYMDLV